MEVQYSRNHPRVGVFGEKPGSDIVKQGYLKKMQTMKKKYFVLRSTSSSGPARLDYFDSEKKFKSGNSHPHRSIPLHTCFNINRKIDSKHKFALTLFLSEECFSVIAENEEEQESWLNLLLQYQNDYLVGGESPKIHYEFVWQGIIKHKSPKSCSGIYGPYRLCLSDESVHLVKTKEVTPSYTFQFSSIRRYGHENNYFVMEMGTWSVVGEGELWMEVDETATAESIYNRVSTGMEKVRENNIFPRSATPETGYSVGDHSKDHITPGHRSGTPSPTRHIERPDREAYQPMSPTGQIPMSNEGLKLDKVFSYLFDDSMSREFPKRAYSVGSRPVAKHSHKHHQYFEMPPHQLLDSSKSSSAPHLIVQKTPQQHMDMNRNPYQDTSQCASSLSQSIKSNDSDNFMEMDFYRPRAASDSNSSRQRSSIFRKQFLQGHRPRSSSYGRVSLGKLAKIEQIHLDPLVQHSNN